jgi:hypothetical protein
MRIGVSVTDKWFFSAGKSMPGDPFIETKCEPLGVESGIPIKPASL